jgi:hypothetical protein
MSSRESCGYVLAIRFGNDANEFLEKERFEEPEQIRDVTWAFNVVPRGDISMTRDFDCCGMDRHVFIRDEWLQG